jgi:hypothetical protein
MSTDQQLSECPNCKRTYAARAYRRRPHDAGRCAACGAQLISANGEKEAEVQARLYGERALIARARPIAGLHKGDGAA